MGYNSGRSTKLVSRHVQTRFLCCFQNRLRQLIKTLKAETLVQQIVNNGAEDG